MALHEALARVEARFQELTDALSDPAVLSNPALLRKTAKERSSLEALIGAGNELRSVEDQLAGNEAIVRAGEDMELVELAESELPGLRARKEELERRVQTLLLPRDPNDDKSVVLEIRAGTGGEEAALFAGEVFRMYQKYAERQGWKVEVLSASPAEMGGMKEVVAAIEGDGAYSKLKWESGVHRVQRVPATEAQGRIHTSAATVAVLPEAEDVDVEIKDDDIVVDVYRSSGKGGQGVNTTDSAVRIHHLPTGMLVTCQDERSQIKNRAKAMKVLRARLLDLKIQKENEERSRARKEQVSTGDRSAKIRTYNFPQGRVTDHRIGLTLYQIDKVLEGEIDQFIDGMVAADAVEVDEKEIRVDVFRSSGPGGQGVNTTDSAVRITHLPTGIVVSCQNERSQIQNRAAAMMVLQTKLLERKREEEQAEMDAIRGTKGDIAFGSQIRNYVLHPYQMVKDLRTGMESGATGPVLDGEIDDFDEAAIRWRRTGTGDEDAAS